MLAQTGLIIRQLNITEAPLVNYQWQNACPCATCLSRWEQKQASLRLMIKLSNTYWRERGINSSLFMRIRMQNIARNIILMQETLNHKLQNRTRWIMYQKLERSRARRLTRFS